MLRLMFILCGLSVFSRQVQAQGSLPSLIINTDIVYDAERIPEIGAEHFFFHNGKLRSWHIDLGYQVNYGDYFGLLYSQGDDVSIGVYRGPAVKIGYSYFTKWNNRKWLNYFSPTLGIKYLWYDSLRINSNSDLLSVSYRMQSENCVQLVPQIYLGQKRIWGHFSYDYYAGIQLPVRFRDKTIYRVVDDEGHVTSTTPYHDSQVIAYGDVVFGIKLGYVASH